MHSPLIHIGYHKTGSTWLQRMLFRKRGGAFVSLADPGANQSSGKTGPKSIGRYLVFSEDGDLLPSYETRTDQIHSVLEKMDLPQNKVPVISNERLTGNPHAGGFDAANIARRIKDAFPQARILIVIREQRSMIASCYYQYLKRGGIHSLENYIRPRYDGAVPKFSLRYLLYHELIGDYVELFGSDRVLTLPYEFFLENGALFVNRICEFAGAKYPTSLPILERVNFRGKRQRAALHRLRLLNAFRRRDSVNDYSLFAVPVVRSVAHATQQVAARFWPYAAAKNLAANTERRIAEIVGDFYRKSNQDASRITGIDLKQTYGYR